MFIDFQKGSSQTSFTLSEAFVLGQVFQGKTNQTGSKLDVHETLWTSSERLNLRPLDLLVVIRGDVVHSFLKPRVFYSKFSLENAPFNLKIFEQLNTSKAHFCTTQNQIFFKNVMVLFYGQGSYLSRLRSHYQMTDYF